MLRRGAVTSKQCKQCTVETPSRVWRMAAYGSVWRKFWRFACFGYIPVSSIETGTQAESIAVQSPRLEYSAELDVHACAPNHMTRAISAPLRGMLLT